MGWKKAKPPGTQALGWHKVISIPPYWEYSKAQAEQVHSREQETLPFDGSGHNVGHSEGEQWRLLAHPFPVFSMPVMSVAMAMVFYRKTSLRHTDAALSADDTLIRVYHTDFMVSGRLNSPCCFRWETRAQWWSCRVQTGIRRKGEFAEGQGSQRGSGPMKSWREGSHEEQRMRVGRGFVYCLLTPRNSGA